MMPSGPKTAQSRHIQTYSYDPNSETLTIQFVNGSIHQWTGVPLTEYHNFDQSASKGTYFHSKIKGQYPSQKLTPRVRK